MPDAGDFGQGSNNHGSNKGGSTNHGPHDQGAEADWAGAFAALPQETPSADAWHRLQDRLPAAAVPMRERRRWPLWLAAAASLALVIGIPLQMRSTTTTATINPPVVTTPSPEPATTQQVTDVSTELASIAIIPHAFEDTSTAASTPPPATTARVRKPRRDTLMDPSQQPIRTVAQPADTTRIVSTEKIDAPASGIDHDALDSLDSLDALYAQSAQLEGLLSLARDDSVSTGTAAALTDALIGQMADIDAVLAQPDTSPQARDDLWRNRVDTLRQLVGIETTQRLYSARGQPYEAALVSID